MNGRQARDEALEEVAAGNAHWVSDAYEAIERLAKRRKWITADDVWREMGEEKPREPRAMGAAMAMARRDKIIAPTSEFVQSRRAVCHARPLRVWRSRIR